LAILGLFATNGDFDVSSGLFSKGSYGEMSEMTENPILTLFRQNHHF
jgi:hypothetical protein